MNRATSIIIGVVLAIMLAGGSFWEGMSVGKAQAEADQSSFLAARGFGGGSGGGSGGAGGAGGAGAQSGAGGAGLGGRRGQNGASGTIDKIDGNTITLTTNQAETLTVQISNNTPVLKSTAGGSVDLKPGAHIVVAGDRSGSNIAARGIQITDRPAGFDGIFGRSTPTPSK